MEKKSSVNMISVLEFQKKHRLTDSQLADKMGVSRSLVCKVKRGVRRPSSSFIHGLVRAGMVPNDIFLRS